MNANSHQVAGTHYTSKLIQPWDFIDANDIPFLEGCAIKYLTRWRDKGGVADLRKAIHFIEKRIELEEANIALNGPGTKQPTPRMHPPTCEATLPPREAQG